MSRRPRQNPAHPANGQSRSAPSSARGILPLAFVLLIGLLALALFGRLLLERRLAIGPTPTITRSPVNTDTPTADFRATINSAESKTQIAYRAVREGINTPTPDATETPTATETPDETPVEIPPTVTPTLIVTVFVPNVGISGVDTATPTSTADTGTIDVETPTSQPDAAAQTATAGVTATALLFTPTPTETPVPTVTPTQPVVGAPPVATLQAVTKAPIPVYAGPSVLYSQINTLPQGLTVRLEGRTSSGEWVRVCCVNNVDGWARQAFFNITGNTAPAGAPPDAKGNDVRWLALQQSNAAPLTPQPTATEIPSADYPLFRRDSGATARVDTQFRPPISYGWPPNNLSTAAAGFTSPPVVVGSLVIAASADLHLYAFDKTIGNQRLKINLNAYVEYAPAVQDPYIYVIDRTGEIIALRDTGAADAVVWRRRLGNTLPSTAMNIRGDTLFVTGQDHVLYALHRLENGRDRWSFPSDGLRLQYPAIGDQMIYVGDAKLSALDIYSGTKIWEDSIINGVAGPPVYARPGVIGLAELYAVDTAGVIHALDANTGTPFWRNGTADRPTALAVDETTLYAAGPGFVAARDRRTGNELWRVPFADEAILGGPIVGNGRILVTGISGSVQVLNAFNGQVVGGAPVTESLAGPPAVSDGWIFLAARNGRLYGMKESN
ncbi:MAG: PQQ-binding-like beta-propeller repeat protein [Chloroflexi bacterium]|nr:PQQ-binding-like beta-propeller repeat protein [Chloroflexota bacterium]